MKPDKTRIAKRNKEKETKNRLREKRKEDKIEIMRERIEQTTFGIARDFRAQPKTLCNSGLFLLGLSPTA